MPEPVKCDGCGAVGVRGLRYPCPTDWFYAHVVVEDLDVGANGGPSTVVIYACAEACQKLIWQRGPGPQIPGADKYIERLRGTYAEPLPAAPSPLTAAPAGKLTLAFHGQPVMNAAGDVIGYLKPPPPAPCLVQEGNCKAWNCPTHGNLSGDG
jgi:hypothetical protein